jgi:hypothetical protein
VAKQQCAARRGLVTQQFPNHCSKELLDHIPFERNTAEIVNQWERFFSFVIVGNEGIHDLAAAYFGYQRLPQITKIKTWISGTRPSMALKADALTAA